MSLNHVAISLLYASLLVSGAMLLPATAVACEDAFPIDLRQTSTSSGPGRYRLEIPTAGVLGLDLASPPSSLASLVFLGRDCTATEPSEADFRVLRETPGGAVVEITVPGTYVFEIMAPNRLATYRLRSLFVADLETDQEHVPLEGAPAGCPDPDLSSIQLAGDCFDALSGIVEQRDCDVLELTTGSPGHVSDEILIELRPDQLPDVRARLDPQLEVREATTGLPELDDLGQRFQVRKITPVFQLRYRTGRLAGDRVEHFYAVHLGPGQDPLEAVAAYREIVPHAQLDYLYEPDLTPNDPLFSEPGQDAHRVTEAEQGWDIETGRSEVAIAVIGTGVELDHEDLSLKIVPGWDFVDSDDDPSPTTSNHETLVAGVAAADTDNALGVAGACWQCSIMPLRVAYTTSHVAQAIDFATGATPPARVINMSFGNYNINKYGPDTIVETAVDGAFAAGIVLVATAGNDSISTRRYPAALDNVVAVAATTFADDRASFSNFGSWVTVAAPGAGILSTTTSNAYATANGTSFAAPYVAGLAALLLSEDTALSPLDARRIIEFTGDRIDTDHFIGSSRVNVFQALAADSVPSLFAVIKSPEDSSILTSEELEIFGTAVGTGYEVEYKLEDDTQWQLIQSGPQTIDDTLATLDPSPLVEAWYDLRLTAHDGPEQAEDQIKLFRLANQLEGWPQSADSAIVASPAYADLDQDGDLELLAATSSAGVFAWHHDGTLVAGWPRQTSAVILTSPTAGDVDGDGDPEVLAASYFDGTVYAWHHDGTNVAGWPRATGSKVRGEVVLAELDGDTLSEIVVAQSDGTVQVWHADGSDQAGWPVAPETNVQTTPLVGDIDGDSDLEIVFYQWNNLYAYHHDGTPVAGWPVALAGNHTSPVLADLDGSGNGALEVVAAGFDRIAAYNGDGTVRVSVPLGATFIYNGLSVGDLDGDGVGEIFATADDGRVFALDAAGSLVPGWPVTMDTPVNGTVGAIVIADLDGDGAKEILSAGRKVYAWEADGTAMAGWPKGVSGDILGTPAFGDLDGDGNGEVIAADVDGLVYVWETGARFLPWKLDWGMEQRDALHNGVFRPIETPAAPTVSISADPSIIGLDEPFQITVSGHSELGLDMIWWFLEAAPEDVPGTVDGTFYPSIVSFSHECNEQVDCSRIWTLTIARPGAYRFGANARDIYYPVPGEPHQASEGAGIAYVDIVVEGPLFADGFESGDLSGWPPVIP